MTKQVLQQALEALEYAAERVYSEKNDDCIAVAIEALREALAQQPEHTKQANEALRQAANRSYEVAKALAQQGEQQEGHCGYESCDCRGYCQQAAAPAAQPDTWTDDGGWTFPIEKPTKE